MHTALLVVVGAGLLWLFVRDLGPLGRWRLRRRMIRRLDPRLSPQDRAAAVRHVHEIVPVARAPRGFAALPRGADPAVPTVPIRVAPLGDGRPGEAFLAPGPNDPRAGALGEDGSRTDVVVGLGPGRALLVACNGRVGAVTRGELMPAAPDRPVVVRAIGGDRTRHVGEVEHAQTAAGPAWRATFVVGNGRITDTHVDHDGWAFAIGVMRRDGETDLDVDRLVDAVLASWQWLPDDPAAAPCPAAPDLPDDPCDATLPVAVGGPEGSTVATCLLPAAPTAVDVPAVDGTWTHLYVRLTRAAALVVTSAPLAGGRDARTALESPHVHPYGPSVLPVGPVTARTTPAGEVLARTFAVGDGVRRTELRLDRDGRTWAWSLTRTTPEPAPLHALDALLASWRWV
ncbi:hypothetical protein [Cellulomonas wangsupingiae]|uniref:Type VII secretion protein EccE n=1 Tax=Cellulomonas wangsupingiae TaxID=2968085 RepID=A0ABY5K124_9CELL|nr:hypothetical protein [Cellulomonas wangsupingiae]MCC2335919.1 hypothetical protein [Cellulomonas wangsupingiae]UUI64144.1 hypothetical protein NP075_13525 [Cellulomonas wangsupingiae]